MLSDNRIFLAIGGALGVLGLLSFVAVAILKVATGHSLDFYYTPRFAVPYVAGLATVVVAVLALALLEHCGSLIGTRGVEVRLRLIVTPNNRWRGP